MDETDRAVYARFAEPSGLKNRKGAGRGGSAEMTTMQHGPAAAAGSATQVFRKARDFLFAHRTDYDAAYAGFAWPDIDRFNWAIDWFDDVARRHPDRPALWIVEEDGSGGVAETKLSFAEMAARSNRVANHLRGLGVRRGDRVLLMLPNVAPLWETVLACMKLGAVVIPATTL